MRNHSMIVDEFFFDPHQVRTLISRQEMKDYKYRDGVTYPGIVELPESVREEVRNNMEMIVGPAYKQVLIFARYSFQDMKPPHWAHSDREIAQHLGLIYLNEGPMEKQHGTATLRPVRKYERRCAVSYQCIF